AWLAWTLGAPDAFTRIMWYFVMTTAVILTAAIARTAILAAIGTGQPEAPAAIAAAPVNPLRRRLSVYHPMIPRLATLAINLLALLALLQLYGVGGLNWLLTTDVGRRVVSGFVTVVVTIALAF